MNRQFLLLIAVNVFVLATGAVVAGPTFVGIDNLQSMAVQVPELGLLAIGVALTELAPQIWTVA